MQWLHMIMTIIMIMIMKAQHLLLKVITLQTSISEKTHHVMTLCILNSMLGRETGLKESIKFS